LVKFEKDANIRDEKGELYHFKGKHFDVNNGLSMSQIHELLANVTSEAAMIYANISRKLME
jgi:hypothetical protein